jgi:hypothetical protein
MCEPRARGDVPTDGVGDPGGVGYGQVDQIGRDPERKLMAEYRTPGVVKVILERVTRRPGGLPWRCAKRRRGPVGLIGLD